MAEYWLEKRYHSLDYDLKKQFGEKVYRISLNGGMSCPNRDGTLGDRGCLFCSTAGSGDFAGNFHSSITSQLASGKAALLTKRPVHKYIAYFQAYSNTYAPVSYLQRIFTEALADPDVVILSIATRPDCLNKEILELLASLNKRKPVWIELGLQTIHSDTATLIRRGFPLSCYERAVCELRQQNLSVITHVILYLPGEDKKRMAETIRYLNQLDIQGVKLHLLHILRDTDLAGYYQLHPFHLPTMDEYIATLCHLLGQLRPDITVHRMTGDGPKELLIEPLWTGNKRTVMNGINRYLKEQNLWQGCLLP